MKLWTIQPQAVLNQIAETGVYRCDPKKSECLTEFGKNFPVAYSWIAGQMRHRIGLPPFSVKYPVWAWHTFAGKHKRPDLRRAEFRHFSEDMVCLEIEIPDHRVLLSDEEDWHMVLNNAYIPSATTPDDIDLEHLWFSTLPRAEQRNAKRKSWEKVLINPRDIPEGIGYIQATFWELRKSQIISAAPIPCRKRESTPAKTKTKSNPKTQQEVTQSGKRRKK